jgi:2-amino-4-hydroxy-6-hydroxymethyldihydropteridine diphosphokinase
MAVKVFIALGSNEGNRKVFLDKAIESFQKHEKIFYVKSSSFHETDPIGGPVGQNKYLNAVVQMQTELSVEMFFQYCQKIERDLGRVRIIKNGPRTIDVDLLLFGTEKINTLDITVPHPRMWDRDFVMNPLKEHLSIEEFDKLKKSFEL